MLGLINIKEDEKNQILKAKILFGLIYVKKNLKDKTFSVRLFGLSIFHSRLKKTLMIYYLFFIPIWIKCANKSFLNAFLNEILTSNNQYDDYYVFLSRSGEFFLLMHHLKRWLQDNKSGNYVLIFTAKYHQSICKLFYPNIPNLYFKNANVPLISKAINSIKLEFRNKNFYFPTCEKYFREVEDNIRKSSKTHYYDCLKEYLNLNNQDLISYSISSETKTKMAKIVKYVLNDNFVFISPETSSCESINKEFWLKLSTKLKELGYEVFCHSMSFENCIDNSTAIFLGYDEAIELVKYAKCIIGMRSGFLECLSQSDTPLIALYTGFPKRNGFKQLKSKDVMSGYSIKKLPNVNTNNIFEIDVNDYKQEDSIMEEIFKIINF